MLLEGLHIPLTTPFHPDGSLSLRKLATNVERYSRTPAAGLIVLGPNGEPTLLDDDETREVLSTVAAAAAPEKVLISGISRDSVHTTLALAEFAAEINYDAILIGLPSVLIFETPETLTYFLTIGDRSPLPVVLLSTRRRPLSIDTAAELAAHPNILGLLKVGSTAPIWELLVRTAAVKREVPVTSTFAAFTSRMKKPPADADATATLVSAASLASKPTGAAAAIAEPPPIPILKAPRTRSKTVGFQILASQTPESLAGLHAGASAIAPAFAACAPQACYEVFAAWKDSDRPLAEEKQLRLVEAARLAEATPAALKFACDLNGYFGGMPRMPHLPPTGEERAALEQLMKPLRN